MSEYRALKLPGILLSAIVLFVGCNKLLPPVVDSGNGKGIVRRLDFEHHQITLSHGNVSTLLHPMTFAYGVKNDSLMQGVVVGDSVRFTIHQIKPGSFVVESLTKVIRRQAAKPGGNK